MMVHVYSQEPSHQRHHGIQGIGWDSVELLCSIAHAGYYIITYHMGWVTEWVIVSCSLWLCHHISGPASLAVHFPIVRNKTPWNKVRLFGIISDLSRIELAGFSLKTKRVGGFLLKDSSGPIIIIVVILYFLIIFFLLNLFLVSNGLR